MLQKGFFEEGEVANGGGLKTKQKKSQLNKEKGETLVDNSVPEVTADQSETTIYHNILQKQKPEGQFTSDPDDPEIMFKNTESTSSEEQEDTSNELIDPELSDRFIADCTAEAERRRSGSQSQVPLSPRVDRGAQLIRDAEASLLQMMGTKGNTCNVNSGVVDENYQVIGSHVDQNTQNKIINHEYVDFARLLS